MWEHGKESIYRNKCEIIKRYDRTKYDEINWSNIKWSTGENRKVTRSNINDQRKRKNKDEIKWALGWCVQQQMPRLQIVLQSFFGGAQKKLLSEESTFLLPKVIKYQRIRTFHNKGYYTQTLNWIIDFIFHGMVSTFPRCLAQIPRHLLATSMTMTMPMKTPSALSFNWEAMI